MPSQTNPPAGPSPRDARIVAIHRDFLEDLSHWVETDRRTALRVLRLVEATMRDPFADIGQPEPLKHLEPNTWSRRITGEHRLVYRVLAERVDFLACRYHYD